MAELVIKLMVAEPVVKLVVAEAAIKLVQLVPGPQAGAP
jgi:hypothetical protein